MKSFLDFHNKMEHFLNASWKKMLCLYKRCRSSQFPTLHFLLFCIKPFWIQLTYFITLSFFGFLALKASEPKATSFKPNNFDLFFTSVSSNTVSSMASVEMEVFTNSQLAIITILMFFGGEVFTSMLGLLFMRFKFTQKNKRSNEVHTVNTESILELGESEIEKSDIRIEEIRTNSLEEKKDFTFECVKILGLIVLGYIIIIHLFGSTLISIYMTLVPSAREVLKRKGINLQIFSIFTTVSTFANCGFIPTNESMIVFKKNSGLLLILIPQILLGNTLYPVCLRLIILIFSKISKENTKFTYILKNPRTLGFDHLLPGAHSIFLAVTVIGFLMVQVVLFCSLEWHSEGIAGLNAYEKLVALLFEAANSRHAGETVFDLSLITPAILVLTIVMMYFPPYTSFMPFEDEKDDVKETEKDKFKGKNLMDWLILSPLSYLVIFAILICITEKDKMKKDPLNFNVLNITFEVISAYGNVGLSIGYSCARQINPDGHCRDAWYGFAGRWSNKGKFILILVMFFGRLKKFSMRGGKAWKLS